LNKQSTLQSWFWYHRAEEKSNLDKAEEWTERKVKYLKKKSLLNK
jgi:hypothetical protein